MGTFSKFGITTDIRKLLMLNTGLTEFVNNRIYPIIAPDNITGDFITYYRDEYSKEYTNFGISGDNCKVFIAIISDNYDRSIEIVELVNDIIEGSHLDKNNNEFRCKLTDSTEDFSDKKYIQILLFEIE